MLCWAIRSNTRLTGIETCLQYYFIPSRNDIMCQIVGDGGFAPISAASGLAADHENSIAVPDSFYPYDKFGNQPAFDDVEDPHSVIQCGQQLASIVMAVKTGPG